MSDGSGSDGCGAKTFDSTPTFSNTTDPVRINISDGVWKHVVLVDYISKLELRFMDMAKDPFGFFMYCFPKKKGNWPQVYNQFKIHMRSFFNLPLPLPTSGCTVSYH